MTGILTALRPLLPYLAAVIVVGAALFGAYRHGVSTTTDRYERILSAMDAANAKATTMAVNKARAEEQAFAAEMAAIDRAHYERLTHEIASRDRAIADLRAGAVQLRQRFACPAAARSAPQPAASADVGDAGTAGGLQTADAEFLLRLAGEADAAVIQLQACQAIVRSDRGQQ